MSKGREAAILGPQRFWVFSCAALVAASTYFFSIFDLSFIAQGNFWRFGEGDAAQHYIGYLYFLHDQWRLPLFYTENLAFPHGTNIIFTDSIPLAALVFKILSPVLPDGFHPFGLWIFACYLLLAHSFCALLYHFGHRSFLTAMTGALFATMTSIFPRLGHAALSGHFLVVYALLEYFKIADSPEKTRSTATLNVLLIVALLVHVYLFVMVAVIYGCTMLHLILKPNRSWKDLARRFLITAGVVGATIFVSGHLSESIPWGDSSDFGHYSMNVLSPIVIGRKHEGFQYWWAGIILLVATGLAALRLHHGRFLSKQLGWIAFSSLVFLAIALLNRVSESYPEATGGQYEGINYLGAGIILLLCANTGSLFSDLKAVRSPRLGPLLIGLLAMAILAVSNKVYLGHYEVFSYSVPWPFDHLLGQFRSSGRFFWAASYSIMALAVVKTLSVRPKWLGAGLLAGALALQLLDMQLVIGEIKYDIHRPAAESILESYLRPIMATHRLVALVPPTQCGGSPELYSKVGRVSAAENVPLQSVLAGRYPAAAFDSCKTAQKDIIENGFSPGILYVIEDKALVSLIEKNPMSGFCRMIEEITVCTLAQSTLKPQQ